jgi:hypothetical protein
MNHQDINRIVSRHFGIRSRDINLPTRKDEILFPRLAAMLLCRQVLKMTLHQIRKAYGKRAVSTIHGALASAGNIYGSRKQFRIRFDAAHAEAITLLPEFRERRQRYNLHYRIRQKKFRVTTPHKTISITHSQEQDLNQDPQLRRLLKEHNYSVQYAIL